MMNFNNVAVTSQGTVPPPSASGVSGVLPGQSAVNTTRILSLTGFSKELKTRDIQNIFVDFEDDRGGYRIKWLDDTGCLIVFSDPLTAKRAFLTLKANPHPHLIPSKTPEGEPIVPKLVTYTGEDVGSVVASVANRPRSRSIANNGISGSPSGSNPAANHARRMSNSSSSMHARGGSVASTLNNSNGGNGDRRSFGRQSLGQGQMQAIIDEAKSAVHANTTGTRDEGTNAPDATGSAAASGGSPGSKGGAIDWQNMMQNSAFAGMHRSRTASATQGGPGYSPPVSPERGMRAGATSPSTLRRLVQQRI